MSKNSAIVRHKLSAPAKWLRDNHLLYGRTFDYGCGRGGDAKILRIPKYDPFWDSNNYFQSDTWGTVLCTYVLNVVPYSVQEKIIRTVRKQLTLDGAAYFSVRRDLPLEGKQGRDCWQRYVEIPHTPIIFENSWFAIYKVRHPIANLLHL